MKKILNLALKNLLRNIRRTALTLLAIITSVAAVIIFGGFVEYTFWGLRESTIRTQLGHVQIYKKGYNEEGKSSSYEYLIENVWDIEKKLGKLPYVDLVTEEISFSGLISSGEKTLNCHGIGINPENGTKFSSFETLLEGKNLTSEENGILLGRELKNALQAKIGDYLTILTTTREGFINAVDLKVLGIVQSGAKEYDSVLVKLPIKQAQRLLHSKGVEKIIVLLEDTKRTELFSKLLTKLIDKENLNIEYKKWSELSVFYQRVVNLYNGLFNVMKIIIALLVLLGISNSVTMSIFERIREIGTLRAMGMKKTEIFLLFICEGALLGLIGGILGIIFAIFFAQIINLFGGIYIPPPPTMNQGYYAQILIVPKVILYSFFSTVIISIFSTIIPAIRGANLNIVEALKYL
jgi:putative ABC transport system permease protein